MEYGNDLPNVWQEWRKTDISYIFCGTLSKKKKKKKIPHLGKFPPRGSVYCIPMEGGRAEENFFLSEKKNFFKVFLHKNKSCPEATNACCDLPWPSRCQMHFFFVNFFPEIGAKWRHSKKTRPKMTKTRKHTYFGHTLSSLNDEKLLVFFLKQTGTNSNLITRQKNRQFLLF